MKKLLLTLALGAAVSLSASADTYYECLFGASYNSKSVNNYTSTWSVTNEGSTFDIVNFNNNENKWADFVKCGRKNNASVATITTAFAATQTINEVVLSAAFNEANVMNAIKLETSATEDFATILSTVNADNTVINTKNATAADLTFKLDNPAANLYYRLTFDCKSAKANGIVWVYSVKYNGGAGQATLEDPALSFPEASYTIKLGEEFTAPELTKATDATPKYTSSKEEVATVDATTGVVTVLAVGTTTITATVDETATYKAGSASYTLVVEDPNTFWAPDCKDTTNPEFTFETISGDFEPWTTDTRYGLKASAYSGGAANASDAVAASPVLDFTKYTAPMTLNYRQALNQFKVNGALIDCTDEAIAPYVSIVAQLDGETEWTKIGDVNAPTAFNWNFYDGAEIDLAQFAGKKVKIGFRYVSTTECAGTWEIDHVVVKAQKISTGVAEIETAENAPVEYFNLQGVRVANPENGLYIRRQGNKVSKVIVK